MEKLFRRADILLPQGVDMTKWSVVACDQFSSQPEYWDTVEQETANVPSTLHMTLPEAYLEQRDQRTETARIHETMERYLMDGLFRELKDSYVYLERTLSDGKVRRGLLGVVDLEAYDYGAESKSPIRATEGTVERRLPPRVEVRKGAALEMPHIMVFMDDPEGTVLPPLAEQSETLPKLYDFDLLAEGGHLRGWQVNGAVADSVEKAIAALADPDTFRVWYGDAAPVIFAIGDGNHSLATAKLCWEQVKPALSEAERETHPARWSLVELVNIHDEAITFEPIHRAVFDTKPVALMEEAEGFFARCGKPGETVHPIRLVTAEGEREITVSGLSIGEVIGVAERFCQEAAAKYGGTVDYIHNDDTAIEMGRRVGCAALLLPKMAKGELFPSIIRSGTFPRKSFSIGLAADKRYYVECRKIK